MDELTQLKSHKSKNVKKIIVPDENNKHQKNICANMTIEYINNRIVDEICFDTIEKLKDENLIEEYKNAVSVKNKIIKIDKILKKHEIDEEKRQSIINDYLLELIPAGTKGVIRGQFFNKIVKKTIKKIHLDENKFEICFEKQCDTNVTSEIPDWYITENATGKTIIGMNQLDLWGGWSTNK